MRRTYRRFAGLVLGLAVVVATFVFVLPRIADYGDVWRVVRELSWEQLAALTGVTVLNLATFPPQWMAALPGLRFQQAFVVTQASTASTYIAPGGPAVGVALSFAMLRSWGFRPRDVGLAVAINAIWNQLCTLGFPVVALVLLTLAGGDDALLQTAALIGLGIFVFLAGSFAVGLGSAHLARRVGDLAAGTASGVLRLLRRDPVTWDGEAFVRFRARTIGLLERRWPVITLGTLAGQLTVFLVLLVSLRVLDVPAREVSATEAFAAWSLARLLATVPITPGGIGVVELGLTSALVGFGGGNAGVVAAVLVYRFLTVVPTLVLGLLSAATWRHHNPGRLDAETAPAGPSPGPPAA
ncbi:MAG TPA: YbhN family protein [Gaiellaceae bacterium]